MNEKIFIYVLAIIMQCNGEIIKDALYFKVIKENGKKNKTRLVWIGDQKKKTSTYKYTEYNESITNEDVQNMLDKQLIAVAFFNAGYEQIKLSSYAVYDNLLEKTLVRQLDPKALSPLKLDLLLQGKSSYEEVQMDDVTHSSYFDLCQLY